jgi:hypothetical protein
MLNLYAMSRFLAAMGFSLTVALRRGQEVPDFGNDER